MRTASLRVLTTTVKNPIYDKRRKYGEAGIELVKAGRRVLLVDANEYEPDLPARDAIELISTSDVPTIITGREFVAEIIANSEPGVPDGYDEVAQMMDIGGAGVALRLIRTLYAHPELAVRVAVEQAMNRYNDAPEGADA